MNEDQLISILEDVYNYGYRMGLARHGHSDQQADGTIPDAARAIQELVAKDS